MSLQTIVKISEFMWSAVVVERTQSRQRARPNCFPDQLEVHGAGEVGDATPMIVAVLAGTPTRKKTATETCTALRGVFLDDSEDAHATRDTL